MLERWKKICQKVFHTPSKGGEKFTNMKHTDHTETDDYNGLWGFVFVIRLLHFLRYR
jgi:hypothetical protein